MAPLRYAAKFDPFLSLDCARVEGVGAQILPSGNPVSLQEGRGGVADLGRRPHEEDQHRLRGGEGQAVRDRRGVGAGWRLQWTGGGHCGDLLAAPRYVEKRLG